MEGSGLHSRASWGQGFVVSISNLTLAKYATTTDWAKLLPKLIELLKVNRTARLQLEADNRKGERRGKLGHWFDVLQRQSGPLVRAIRICEKTVDSSTIPSAEATNGGASSQVSFIQ